MNTTLRTIVCAAAMTAFAGAPYALAQNTRTTTRDQDTTRTTQPTRDTTYRAPANTTSAGAFDLMLNKASELRGKAVYAPNGDKIGDVADFVVSRQSGVIDSALVNTGSILGVGGKEVRVAYPSLTWNTAKSRLETNMTKASIDAMPAFDRKATDLSLDNVGDWDDMGYDHDSMNHDNMNRDKMDPNDPAKRDMNRDKMDPNDPAHRDMTRKPGMTHEGETYGPDRGILLSTIIGHNLDCLTQSCGEVQDAVVEVNTGRVLYLVIDPDENFLGIADTLRLAPFSIARWDLDASDMKIDATKEQLLNAPEFKGDLAGFSARNRVNEVYGVYDRPAPRLDRRASDRMNHDTMHNTDNNMNNHNTTNPDRTTTPNDDKKTPTKRPY